MTENVYATFAQEYFAAGMWPLPVWPGQKATYVKEWQKKVFDEELIKSLTAEYPAHGIAVRLGSPIGSSGYVLACLDVDYEPYSKAALTLFRNPPCAKVGKKGITIFVQASPKLINKDFIFKQPHLQSLGKAAEFFTRDKITVIPPTLHPDTGRSYEWRGKPLLEMDLIKLPILEA